jgi:hypothetical protein
MPRGHSLQEVFALLNRMVDEQVADSYAVVGAMAVRPHRSAESESPCC